MSRRFFVAESSLHWGLDSHGLAVVSPSCAAWAHVRLIASWTSVGCAGRLSNKFKDFADGARGALVAVSCGYGR